MKTYKAILNKNTPNEHVIDEYNFNDKYFIGFDGILYKNYGSSEMPIWKLDADSVYEFEEIVKPKINTQTCFTCSCGCTSEETDITQYKTHNIPTIDIENVISSIDNIIKTSCPQSEGGNYYIKKMLNAKHELSDILK